MRRVQHLDATVLVDTPVVEVTYVACCAPRSRSVEQEWNEVPQIVLPRRGLFTVHRCGETVLADATSAMVFGAEEGYRASHPRDGGDECLVLEFTRDVHEEALGGARGCSGRLAPRTQLGAWLFACVVRRHDRDALYCEEGALLLLDAVASDLTDASGAGARVSKAQCDRVDQVRTLIADDLGRRWRLDGIGRAVHCSPFHLARQFRWATGETISRYLLRLRLAAALDRIAEGDSDLARLAAELGFSHHSHFTARFRSVFGCTPGGARATLTAPHIRDLSTILTADRDLSTILTADRDLAT
jgi:AraC family transcriptional regulator